MSDRNANPFAKRLPTEAGQLHALCPAGMGDFLWIWSKWHSVAAERDVTFWFPQAEQQRAGGVAQMFGARYGYLPGLSTNWVWGEHDDMCEPDIPDTGGVLRVNANRHLEAGKRLERWYPDLPYRAPVPRIHAALYKQEAGGAPYVVAFTSHAGYMDGNLMPGQWARLFRQIENEFGMVCLIGAGGDPDFGNRITAVWDPTLAPVYNAPIDQVCAVLAGARAFVGVASGPSILSAYLGTPTFHAYPRCHPRLAGSWEPEEGSNAWCWVDELDLYGLTGLKEVIRHHADRNTGDNQGTAASAPGPDGGGSGDDADDPQRLPEDHDPQSAGDHAGAAAGVVAEKASESAVLSSPNGKRPRRLRAPATR